MLGYMRDKYVLMRKYDYDSKQNTSNHNLMTEKISFLVANDMSLFRTKSKHLTFMHFIGLNMIQDVSVFCMNTAIKESLTMQRSFPTRKGTTFRLNTCCLQATIMH